MAVKRIEAMLNPPAPAPTPAPMVAPLPPAAPPASQPAPSIFSVDDEPGKTKAPSARSAASPAPAAAPATAPAPPPPPLFPVVRAAASKNEPVTDEAINNALVKGVNYLVSQYDGNYELKNSKNNEVQAAGIHALCA